LVEISQDIVKRFSVADYRLGAFRGHNCKVDVSDCLVHLTHKDIAQFFDCGFVVVLKVSPDALLLMNGHPVPYGLDNVD
jgi:hypothetical protein